jgi:hypothetical protein
MPTRQGRAINAAVYGLIAWQFSSLGTVGLLGGLWAAIELNTLGLVTAPMGVGFMFVAVTAFRAMKREIESPYF